MPHLFTMNTAGDVFNASGKCVACLHDSSHVIDFLSGVAAGIEAMAGSIPGEIIRDGDYQAWEAATVRRQRVAV